ncbi:MAG: FAD-binding oxidoreductase [Clostridiales bacterium]
MDILITILSVSAISTILAVLIIISERIFNNYGNVIIDINDGTKTLEVEGGSNLLSTLSGQKIFIPSACGGKATCGVCKLQVLDGGGELLPTEEPFLSPEEKKDDVRLSCQLKVKQNLKIKIPEEFFLVKEYKTIIEGISDMTHDIKEFRFALPEEIKFKAGQYVQVKTKPYGKIKESVFRAYSISSVPSDNKAVELIIRRVPNGLCTTYMHDHVKEGEEVMITGPYGDFYARDDAEEYVMIAGGSGLAPIKSIVEDVLEKGLDTKMIFFFGAVSKKDLYYVEYFKKLDEKYDQFSYVPALSNPTEQDNWTGEIGLITDVVAKYIENGDGKQGYLCGSPGMINACISVLTEKGIDESLIFYDKF